LKAFVAGSADVSCRTSKDGVYRHAELRWTGGVAWAPVASPTPEELGQDLTVFAAWAQTVADWIRSKPVPTAPATTVVLRAQYGKEWVVPLDARSRT
jgi:hypothetical protein